MQYDVIVVGAGPAGSTAAREAAARGLSVLMVDKAEFPRDKPCGGGVTVRAAGLLPFDLAPVIERTISHLSLTDRQSRPFTRHSAREVTYFTQRSRLDAYLAERAVDAGATFRQREAVLEVRRSTAQVVVRTDCDTFEGRTLVVADGANGQTAKLAGVAVNLLHAIALEGNVTPAGGVPAEWKETMGFDVGGLPGGYGWLFPKADHLNIGLGGWRYVGPTLRDKLEQLVRFYGFDPSKMWGVQGYHLPLRQNGSPLVDGNVVLVGDAAGLVDPLTGEGIHAGISSGRAAAGQIAAHLRGESPDLDGYRRELEGELLPELSVSRQLHDVFHLWPGLFLGIDRRSSILWRTVVPLLRGEITYLGTKRRLGALWSVVEFISDLVRVAPPLRRVSGLRDPAPPERFFRRRAQHETNQA